MSDVIATVRDFDKTLIPGYMQEPIFLHCNMNGNDFWHKRKSPCKQYTCRGLSCNALYIFARLRLALQSIFWRKR